MSSNTETGESKKEGQKCGPFCPINSITSMVGQCLDRNSEVYKHLTKSRVEMLKAFRSLVDRRIEILEERIATTTSKKATKITVE